jgi:hypothetical protein
MRHIVICGLPGSTILFHITSQKAQFYNKTIYWKWNTLNFCTTFSEIFLFMRRIMWDLIINMYWSLYILPVTLFRFWWNTNMTILIVYFRNFVNSPKTKVVFLYVRNIKLQTFDNIQRKLLYYIPLFHINSSQTVKLTLMFNVCLAQCILTSCSSKVGVPLECSSPNP